MLESFSKSIPSNTMVLSSIRDLAVLLTALTSAVQCKEIYVSPSGTGSGSQTAPYGSIQSAVNAAAAGDTIFLRAGTYKPTTNIQITKSGTRTSPITLRSYEKEKVIIDGEGLPGCVEACGHISNEPLL
jgi:pectin methylesterase-like acyl-CoA thioesterase